jgi:hypothetical protein
MDLLNIDKETLKAAFSESLHENRAFFEEIVKKVIDEKQNASSEIEDDERTKKIKSIIKADFIKYETVFKKLA